MFVPVKDKLDKLVALTPDDQEKLSHYKYAHTFCYLTIS